MTKVKLNLMLAAILVCSSGFTCQKKYPTAKPSESENAESAESNNSDSVETNSAEPQESAEPSSASEEKKSSSDN